MNRAPPSSSPQLEEWHRPLVANSVTNYQQIDSKLLESLSACNVPRLNTNSQIFVLASSGRSTLVTVFPRVWTFDPCDKFNLGDSHESDDELGPHYEAADEIDEIDLTLILLLLEEVVVARVDSEPDVNKQSHNPTKGMSRSNKVK